MKRKYYMRGLGIGVIVTAVLFTLVFPKNKQEMTEAEIIAKAKELGYVKKTEGVTPEDIDKIKEQEGIGTTPGGAQDSTTTPEPSGTPGPTTSPVPTPDAPTPPEEPDKPDAPETPTNVPTREVLPDTPTPEPTATPTREVKPTATVAPTKAPATGVITVKVERGMTATKVARLLEAAGAIDSATEFASYLRENNLADEINIGTFSIPAGATYEEIGKLLTEIR